MSNFWSAYIIVLVTANITLCYLLLRWTSKMDLNDLAEDGTTGHEYDGIKEYNNPLPRWWLYLFYITIVFAVGYLVLYPGYGSFPGVLHWSSHGEHDADQASYEHKYGPIYEHYYSVPIEQLAQDKRAMQIGNRLFENNCAACHGSDARGARGFPNLTDSDWLKAGTPASIEDTILKGRDAMMPNWGPTLGAQGVEEVANYVLTLSGRTKGVDQKLAQAGQARFAVCAGCHGADGKGNQAIGAPNLTDSIWLYGGDKATVIQTITNGRKGHMPTWEAALGKERVHLLAAYVWSLSNNP
jgi:cytochrome c oxidase cbb3-type subunit 3